MIKKKNTGSTEEDIPFQFHPRVFSSLGADLVTSDVVAIIELVKNSYDAMAKRVDISIERDGKNSVIEIKDDGCGMSLDTVRNVWCMVATPFKYENREIGRGARKRRVSGEKGLGRLAAARLGGQLEVITQAEESQCYEVKINWESIAKSKNSSSIFAKCKSIPNDGVFKRSGTMLRVLGLKSSWRKQEVQDLRDNLARLLSPFAEIDDFKIYLSIDSSEEDTEVLAPEFLNSPKYKIEGTVDDTGKMKCEYRFNAIKGAKKRSSKETRTWEQIFDDIQDPERHPFDRAGTSCGPFSFEIRAWDIGADDTLEISERFDVQKNSVRKAIGVHKGISVYRDGILVLPKSETAKDWMGLDLRRVSKTGVRMSTSQLVGYVSISADQNPKLSDTSDRERFVSSVALGEFEEILIAIVGILENERAQDRDRQKEKRVDSTQTLFSELSAASLFGEVSALAKEGASASEVMPLINNFKANLEKTSKEISERFVYYSRMATVGTIASMLVHEIRGKTMAFGAFISFVKKRFGPFNDAQIERKLAQAQDSVDSLEHLADTFAPLASRNFSRGGKSCLAEEALSNVVELLDADITKRGIRISIPKTSFKVAIDPGELGAVFTNLFTNSIYWLTQVEKDAREIQVRFSTIDDGKRLRVWFHDSGPGIPEELAERVLLPGVTKRPNGLGMGLTVASEIVAMVGGELKIKCPGNLRGASICFDLPTAKN